MQTVWAPCKARDMKMLQNIQRRCTRQVTNLKNLPSEDWLRILKLPTLSYHHLRGDLIEVYKILHGFYDKELV